MCVYKDLCLIWLEEIDCSLTTMPFSVDHQHDVDMKIFQYPKQDMRWVEHHKPLSFHSPTRFMMKLSSKKTSAPLEKSKRRRLEISFQRKFLHLHFTFLFLYRRRSQWGAHYVTENRIWESRIMFGKCVTKTILRFSDQLKTIDGPAPRTRLTKIWK